MIEANVPRTTTKAFKSLFFGAVSLGAALVAASPVLAAEDVNSDNSPGVFAMTNDADANEVVAYERTRLGTLTESTHYRTGGRGGGGTVDPLASQGALTLSNSRSWLFAVNAGSGTVSVFRVRGSRLELTDRVPTQGSEPNAVAEHDGLVYVLNAAGSNSVVGFRLAGGKLTRIADSLRFLSANGANAASLAFSPDGRFLVVTERATNLIDVFKVSPDGLLSTITQNQSASPGVFSVTFAPNGTAITSETGTSAPNSSTASSYSVNADGTLTPISAGVPTLGGANCWDVVTPGGRFVYASNSASSSISGFAVGSNGALTALAATVVGHNPSGATNLELVVSSDGKFLYSLNAGNGTIGTFAIDPTTGALTSLGTVGGLPSSGVEGLAAN